MKTELFILKGDFKRFKYRYIKTIIFLIVPVFYFLTSILANYDTVVQRRSFINNSNYNSIFVNDSKSIFRNSFDYCDNILIFNTKELGVAKIRNSEVYILNGDVDYDLEHTYFTQKNLYRGRFAERNPDSSEIVISFDAYKELNKSIGDIVYVGDENRVALKIVGIMKPKYNDKDIFVPKATSLIGFNTNDKEKFKEIMSDIKKNTVKLVFTDDKIKNPIFTKENQLEEVTYNLWGMSIAYNLIFLAFIILIISLEIRFMIKKTLKSLGMIRFLGLKDRELKNFLMLKFAIIFLIALMFGGILDYYSKVNLYFLYYPIEIQFIRIIVAVIIMFIVLNIIVNRFLKVIKKKELIDILNDKNIKF